MRLEKVFNDILGFRMLVDSYDTLLKGIIPEEMRIVDMSFGKANDDIKRIADVSVAEYAGMRFSYEIIV